MLGRDPCPGRVVGRLGELGRLEPPGCGPNEGRCVGRLGVEGRVEGRAWEKEGRLRDEEEGRLWGRLI